ncbi:hypothetical protein D3C86_1294370 [compost metagenome]
MIEAMGKKALVRLFIDNSLLYFWQCHRLSERSFFLDGRQFHLCARCTGIVLGLLFSPFAISCKSLFLPVFLASLCLVAVDGYTQLLGWRESNNFLRCFTGLFLGLSALPTVVSLSEQILERI